jgi:hypothetical protein
MYSTGAKGSTQTNKKVQVRVQKKGAKETEALVWHTGLSGVPPDSVRCTRGNRLKLFTFGFLESRFAIIHRTVRCTSGATTIERNGQLQRSPANVNSAQTIRVESEQRQKAHRTVNSACPVPQDVSVGVLGPTAHPGLPLKVFLGVGRCRRL